MKIQLSNKLRGYWLGDWNNSAIFIHKKVKKLGMEYYLGVLTHEAVERKISKIYNILECCNKNYNEKKHGELNKMAHKKAGEVEQIIIESLGLNWEKYIQKLEKLRMEIYNLPINYYSNPCKCCYKKEKCKNGKR